MSPIVTRPLRAELANVVDAWMMDMEISGVLHDDLVLHVLEEGNRLVYGRLSTCVYFNSDLLSSAP